MSRIGKLGMKHGSLANRRRVGATRGQSPREHLRCARNLVQGATLGLRSRRKGKAVACPRDLFGKRQWRSGRAKVDDTATGATP